MTENELLAECIKLAEKHGVLYFHSTDSRRDKGRGFPDLTLAGIERVAFAELKSSTGDTRVAQTQWAWRLRATGSTCFLWRPKDLKSGEIEARIRELNAAR